MVESAPSRLGRGLGALLAPRPGSGEGIGEGDSDRAHDGAPAGAPGPAYREVPVAALRPNPRQPRTAFDEDALAELAASITEVGLLQPIVVRPLAEDRYEIVMGERRWRAATLAGLDTVPVLVRETASESLLRDALLENLHRANLNPLDEAAAYAQLLDDFGATHEQLASRLGRSRAHVSNTLRLMHLPPAVQRRLAAGVLSAGHARAILGLPDAAAQERVAARVAAEGLSVRAVEELVAVGPDGSKPRRPRRRPTAGSQFPEVAAALAERWDTRVRIASGRSKGRLVVDFGSVQDLDRILGLLAPEVRGLLAGSSEPDLADPAPATAGTWTGNGQSG